MEAGRGPRERRLPDRPAHPPGLRLLDPVRHRASRRLPPARRRVSSSSPTSRRRTTSSSATASTASEVFHDASGGYNRFDPDVRASGPDPQRRTYASFAEFSDPDGNVWQLQEITNRLPGRVDPTTTTFSSVADLASALRRAAAAHGEHEARTGQADANWPDWYAAYMVAEQSGAELPT